MDIKQVLQKDHRETLQLAEELCSAELEGKELTEKFNMLYEMVLAHSHAEQKTLYKQLKDSGKEELSEFTLEAEIEHKLVEDMLGLLKRSRKKGSAQWMARCKVVKELLEHHIEEEENEMLPLLDSEMDTEQKEILGEEMLKVEEQERKKAA